MFLIFSLLVSGSFTQLVNDPAEMRFCAAGSAIYADEARKRDGKDSDDGQFFDIIELKFKSRLAQLNADDPTLVAKEKAAIAGPLGAFYRKPTTSPEPPVATRYSKCLNLVFGAQENEALTNTATVLDEAMQADGEKSLDVTPVTEIEFNPLEYLALATASEPRKAELRCALFAAMLVKRKNAAPARNDWGMSVAKSDLLRRRVTEMLVIETGVSARAVDRLFDEVTGSDADGLQDSDLAGCKLLFDSIDPGADGGGRVGLLSALESADAPSAPQCYALLSRLAKEQSGDEAAAASSESAAQKIADDFLLRHADDPEMAGTAMAFALADLDRKAKTDQNDQDGEVRIAACRKMAAEID